MDTSLGFQRKVWSRPHGMPRDRGSGEGGENQKPAGVHPCGPPARGVWKRKNREAEKQKDPRQTDVREPRPGGQWRETPDGSVPEAQPIKAPPKPFRA